MDYTCKHFTKNRMYLVKRILYLSLYIEQIACLQLSLLFPIWKQKKTQTIFHLFDWVHVLS